MAIADYYVLLDTYYFRRFNHFSRQGSVQMLLAVQNVAVENLALALKTFDHGNLK